MRHTKYMALAILALATPAYARPLDPQACDAARQEQAAMSDVPPLMERGPDWARSNSTPQALQRVNRWIELSEMLSFRCGRGPVSAEAQRAAAAADLIENPPPEPAAPEAAKLNAVPAASPESVPQPAAAAPAAPIETPPAKKTKAKAKSKPKPPVDSGEASSASAPAATAPDQPPPKKRKQKPAAASVAPEAQPPSAQ